jgi:hypothetical protein
MNDQREMAAPHSVGITWSTSESGKLLGLTTEEGTSAVGASKRRSRHGSSSGSGSS